MLKNVKKIRLGDAGTAGRCGNRHRIYQHWRAANAGRKTGLDQTV